MSQDGAGASACNSARLAGLRKPGMRTGLAGRQVAEQELRPSQVTAAALFDGFTPEERGELLRLLRKVADSN